MMRSFPLDQFRAICGITGTFDDKERKGDQYFLSLRTNHGAITNRQERDLTAPNSEPNRFPLLPKSGGPPSHFRVPEGAETSPSYLEKLSLRQV